MFQLAICQIWYKWQNLKCNKAPSQVLSGWTYVMEARCEVTKDDYSSAYGSEMQGVKGIFNSHQDRQE